VSRRGVGNAPRYGGRYPLRLVSANSGVPNDATEGDTLEQFRRDTPLSEEEFQGCLRRLDHVNAFQRQKASLTLAANLRSDTIPELLKLLEQTETRVRRQAVQTLGVIGSPAISAVCSLLATSENPTTRASCCKSLTAIVTSFPELRETFPSDAVDTLRHALVQADPVIRISACISLGELGSADSETGSRGNPKVLPILLQALRDTEDIALASSLAGALGTIGMHGDKDATLKGLREVMETKSSIEGGEYFREIAESCIERIESGLMRPSKELV